MLEAKGLFLFVTMFHQDFPGGSVSKGSMLLKAGDTGLSPGQEVRSHRLYGMAKQNKVPSIPKQKRLMNVSGHLTVKRSRKPEIATHHF